MRRRFHLKFSNTVRPFLARMLRDRRPELRAKIEVTTTSRGKNRNLKVAIDHLDVVAVIHRAPDGTEERIALADIPAVVEQIKAAQKSTKRAPRPWRPSHPPVSPSLAALEQRAAEELVDSTLTLPNLISTSRAAPESLPVPSPRSPGERARVKNPSNTPGFTNICVNMDLDLDVNVDLDANVDADVVAVVHLDAAGGGSCRRRGMFGFQRLDVYRASTQFLGLTSKLVARIPRGHRDLIDQLRRAALIRAPKIAEESGKFSETLCASIRLPGAPPWSAQPCSTHWKR